MQLIDEHIHHEQVNEFLNEIGSIINGLLVNVVLFFAPTHHQLKPFEFHLFLKSKTFFLVSFDASMVRRRARMLQSRCSVETHIPRRQSHTGFQAKLLLLLGYASDLEPHTQYVMMVTADPQNLKPLLFFFC